MIKHLAVLKSPIAAPVDAPEWWRFLPAGEIHIIGGPKPLIMDDEAAALVLKYFKHLGRDIVIDYEHQTLDGVQAPAAAWIKEFDWRGKDGLWVRTEWTRTAAKYIAAKEYRYYSPVMLSRPSDGRIVAIINAALTNEPKTRNLEAIAAKLELNVLTNQPKPKESTMFEKLIKILNLKPDADQAAVEAAVKAVVEKNTELQTQMNARTQVVACKGVLDALGLEKNAAEQVIVAKIKGLAATGTATEDLSRQVADLSSELAGMKAGQLTAQALKNGQTSPDELKKWGNDLARNNPEQFEAIVCSRAHGSVIPVERIRTVKDPAGEAELDDAVLTVAKLMGNDPEEVKKHIQ